jgi:hypothetical protein
MVTYRRAPITGDLDVMDSAECGRHAVGVGVVGN